MERMFRSGLIVMLVFCVYPLSVCQGDDSSGKAQNIVLTPADQLILDAIDKVNDRIDKVNERIDKVNERIDKVNERIDNLWITMLGGFMGVMAFIGALVFWDRRTFMKRAREEMRSEVAGDRNKMEGIVAALKKVGEQFPEVREVLRSFGLL
jgi:tetrahydromethanopterin S-methyltransferase subunit G